MKYSVALMVALSAALSPSTTTASLPNVGGCDIFPADSWWNTPIDSLPAHSSSTAWVNSIGSSTRLKADFGSGLWEGYKIGIPYVVVPQSQANVPVDFIWWPEQSDAGPYPIPNNAPIEGGGDHHVIVIQQGTCMLYELYAASKPATGWEAGSGAKFNLASNDFRPLEWTSADAAGLPIFPGLVRYDEIVAGEINHAIRFTAPSTRNQFIWPATHMASSSSSASLPPMGARFRLKADFDISGFPSVMQVILRALKKYGLVLADNGSSWYMSGVPDERWDNDMLNEELTQVLGRHMEAVDVSSLMVSATSGQVTATSPTPPTTRRPTTQAPTSASPTTKSPVSKAPSLRPTSKAPSSKQPTVKPTSKAPSSKKPTVKPTSKAPSSKTPTRKPTSRSPTTKSPVVSKSPTKFPTKRRRGLDVDELLY